MYLFLILACPCFLVWYLIASKDFNFKEFIPVIAIGITAGIVLSIVNEFFIYSNHVWVAKFGSNFLHIFLKDMLIPVLLTYGIFLLVSIKSDDFYYKTNAFLPEMMGFYAVYLPYSVISGDFKHSAYLLFVEPFLIVAMCWLICETAVYGWRIITEKKSLIGIAFIASGIIFLALPAAFITMWYLKVNLFIVMLLSVIYAAAPVAGYIFIQKKGADCPYPPFIK